MSEIAASVDERGARVCTFDGDQFNACWVTREWVAHSTLKRFMGMIGRRLSLTDCRHRWLTVGHGVRPSALHAAPAIDRSGQARHRSRHGTTVQVNRDGLELAVMHAACRQAALARAARPPSVLLVIVAVAACDVQS